MIEAQHHRKGRTSRRRSKRSISAKIQNLSSDPAIVVLIQWMCNKGWKATSKLRLVSCKYTGRGLQTVNGVKLGDTLVSIPKRLLITLNVVLRYFRIQKLTVSLPEHHLLAVFIVLQIRLGNASDWFPYCQTLPKIFSTPAYCSENEVSYLPSFIQNLAISQNNKLHEAFSEACTFWESLVLSRKISKSLIAPTFSEFKSAWFVVNTRAVYMQDRVDVCHAFKDNNKSYMALAPFLDMFNHSFEAEVEAGFNALSGSYEIRSLNPYPPRNQVFINYGPHDNLKLYVDYGFYLSGNPHDSINFKLNEVLSYVGNVCPISPLKGPKMEFLLRHNLLADLSCTHEGLSWNLSALLYIISLKKFCRLSWSTVFRGDWIPYESEVERQMALQIVKCKKLELLECQNHMLSLVSYSDSYKIAKDILKEYIIILSHAEVRYEQVNIIFGTK